MRQMKQRNLVRYAAAACMVLCTGAVQAQGTRLAMLQTAGPSAGGVSNAGMMQAESVGDPQAKDDLLEGLDRLGANAKERNEVNLDKNMLALAGGKKGGRYADLSQKMDFITVRNYEFASKGQYQKGDLDALRHRLEGNGWSHIVRNEDQEETNDIVVKADNEGFIRDMVILNAEPKELNIVHLRGHFRMEDVQGAMGMSAVGAAMGGAPGRAAAGPQPPNPPTPPVDPTLKKR